MNFQIRLAQSEDLERIIELQSRSIRLMSADYNPRQIEALVRSQASARLSYDEISFLAFYNDELVGFACLIDNSFQVGGVYVHPNFTRQGIGTQLLEVIEKTASQKGCKVIQVMSSLTAVNFYQARGYQVIRQSGFFSEFSTWIPCIILKKYLVPLTKGENSRQRINYFYSWLKLLMPTIKLIIFFLIGTLLASIILRLIELFS